MATLQIKWRTRLQSSSFNSQTGGIVSNVNKSLSDTLSKSSNYNMPSDSSCPITTSLVTHDTQTYDKSWKTLLYGVMNNLNSGGAECYKIQIVMDGQVLAEQTGSLNYHMFEYHA